MNDGDEMRYRARAEDTAPDGDQGQDEAAGALREDGPGARGGAAFDPTRYMRQLRGRAGGQDYLDVKWRLLWLRREHPDAEIVTEHVRIDDGSAIFKATVTLPSGGKATGYGSETASDFGDFIEKAETKAIGRALNALGYGAQFAEGDDEPAPAGEPHRPSPRQTPAAPRAASPAAAPAPAATEQDGARAATPAPTARQAEAVTSRGAPPIDFVASRERAGQTAAPAASRPAEADAAEPEMADYSYTHFWRWARGLGYNSKGAIEELIGRPMSGLTPAQARDLLRAARGEG